MWPRPSTPTASPREPAAGICPQSLAFQNVPADPGHRPGYLKCSCWDRGNIYSLPGSGVPSWHPQPFPTLTQCMSRTLQGSGASMGSSSPDEGSLRAQTRGPPAGQSLVEEMRPHHRGAGVQPTAWPCPHCCPSMKPTCRHGLGIAQAVPSTGPAETP